MVAYLTRPRQKYENGGPVLPKEKPSAEQIKKIQWRNKLKLLKKVKDGMGRREWLNLVSEHLNDGVEEEIITREQFNTALSPLFGQAGEGQTRALEQDDSMPIKDVLEIQGERREDYPPYLLAEGGVARRKYFAGALGMAPTVAYPATVGVAKLLGISTAGLGAKELSDVVTQKIQENPEVLETPQAKAIMLAFGLTPGGLIFGPDADEMEKERQRIAEDLKPEKTYVPDNKGWAESFPDDSATLGPKVTEPPVSPPVEMPQLEGFPDQSQELNKPIILNLAKDKKEVKEKLEAIEPYRGADFIGTSTKKDRTKDKEFLKVFEEYKNTHFGGNESAAARSLNESREKIRGIRLRTTAGEDRKTGRISTAAEEIITTEVPENPIRLVDATTEVKRDQNYFKDFLTKENKNEYMSPQNIANVLDFKFGDGSSERLAKSERDAFIQELNNPKLNIKSKEVPGKRYKKYKLSDVVNKLTEKYKGKRVKGEVMSQTERMEVENRLDPELYSAVLNTAKSRVNALLKEEGLKVDLEIAPRYIIDDIGHTVSIKETDKFPKLFKNSNVNKINSLVYEDPLINQEVKKVTGYESKHNKWFVELNDMVDKEITKDQRTRLKDIKEQMEDNYSELVETVGDFDELKAALKKARPDLKISDSYIKYLTGHTDRLGQIDINIPKVGEKFKSEDIFVDMSNVDEKYIIGYIDKINPKAKLFSDLSTKEKEIYEANVIAQNAEILGDYFRKIGVPESEIKSMQDEFYYPTPSREWKVRKATGGPVYGKYAKQIAGIS
jgi:hypothetical protein